MKYSGQSLSLPILNIPCQPGERSALHVQAEKNNYLLLLKTQDYV